MFKLHQSAYTSDTAIDLCCQGIGDKKFLKKIQDNRHYLEDAAIEYNGLACSEKLHTLTPIPKQIDVDPVILGDLTKSELIKLYDNYFSAQNKPKARAIYDSLITAAKEKCPYCGGVGRPRNLDHYLPKAEYPKFSVHLDNLVPSCRDCNMESKGNYYASSLSEQILHPYLDSDRYFCEQWLFARHVPGKDLEPGVIEYFVQAPEHWDQSHKLRVQYHFTAFDLSKRFSIEAAVRLPVYTDNITTLSQIIDFDQAKECILRSAIERASFANEWERVMCLTLIDAPKQDLLK